MTKPCGRLGAWVLALLTGLLLFFGLPLSGSAASYTPPFELS